MSVTYNRRPPKPQSHLPRRLAGPLLYLPCSSVPHPSYPDPFLLSSTFARSSPFCLHLFSCPSAFARSSPFAFAPSSPPLRSPVPCPLPSPFVLPLPSFLPLVLYLGLFLSLFLTSLPSSFPSTLDPYSSMHSSHLFLPHILTLLRLLPRTVTLASSPPLALPHVGYPQPFLFPPHLLLSHFLFLYCPSSPSDPSFPPGLCPS